MKLENSEDLQGLQLLCQKNTNMFIERTETRQQKLLEIMSKKSYETFSIFSSIISEGNQLSGVIKLNFLNSVSIINAENDKFSKFTHGHYENS